MSPFHPLRDGGKEVGELTFEWDANKEKLNIEKHGISFDEAAKSFAGRVLIAGDDIHSTPQEARFHALGLTDGERIILIVHCIRGAGDIIRIISARRANQDEREIYRKATANG